MADRAKNASKKIALLGILGAQALTLSFLENLIPPLPGMPPGVKPGFSNIVTMYAIQALGPGEAFFITLLKALFAGLTRGPVAFVLSFAGGMLSTVVMILLLRPRSPFGLAGVSVAGALAHNSGQLAGAVILTGTAKTAFYAPLLVLSAVVTGLITGTVLKVVMPVLEKQRKYFI